MQRIAGIATRNACRARVTRSAVPTATISRPGKSSSFSHTHSHTHTHARTIAHTRTLARQEQATVAAGPQTPIPSNLYAEGDHADARHAMAGLPSSPAPTHTHTHTHTRSAESDGLLHTHVPAQGYAHSDHAHEHARGLVHVDTGMSDVVVGSMDLARLASGEGMDDPSTRLIAAHARQYDMETRALEENVHTYRQLISDVIAIGRGASLPIAQRLVVDWFRPLVQAIDAEQAAIWNRQHGVDRTAYGPYLILLPPEKLAVVTIHEVLNQTLIFGGAARVAHLAVVIGSTIQAEVNMMKLRYQDRRTWSKLAAGKGQNLALVRRHARRVLNDSEWGPKVHAKLGGALINMLLECARLEVRPDGRLLYEEDDPAAAKKPVSSLSQSLSQLVTRSAVGERVARGRAASGRAPVADSAATSEDALDGLDIPGASGPVSPLAAAAAAVGVEISPEDLVATHRHDAEGARREVDAVTGRERFTVPAFRHMYMRQAGKVVGTVTAHPRIMELLDDSAAKFAHPTQFPMLVPPRPWIGPYTGGYLKQRMPLVRMVPGSRLQMELIRQAWMPRVYEALTVLGTTPWRINPFVHKVLREVWESGGGICEVPSRSDVPIPGPPAPEDLAPLSEDDRKKALRRHAAAARHAMKTNADRHSLRCDMLLKLDVAQRFENDIMYYPFNIDFRGRVYPVPPHLNHMGSDACRGLLMFAHAKPLGARGLRWLKIHLSNLMGKDKISMDDRAAYTEANMAEVIDSAERPLTGNGWWMKADSPFQALAACRELANAMRLPDPTMYECSLPVHQDGSCNGLQHYAALGRDEDGGRAVNLLSNPEDKPADVYSKVLQLVLRKLDADAALPGAAPSAPAAGDTDSATLSKAYAAAAAADDENVRAALNVDVKRIAARFLKGSVDRKVVKQTVMTSVYGVTFIGAREQILARLKEKFEGHPMPVDELEETLFVCASYLARTTLDSLGDLFAAADAIKKWLGDVARLVALAEQPMSWITPLGLPVVQPYRREHSALVRTVLQDVLIADSSEQLPVSSTRQKSAFPPNFVHSLDSTHMMLTALDCSRRGLTFTAVHDSFWTHACDVDTMSESLREQFVQLYSMPLLEQFRASLVLRFPYLTIPDLPPRGSLNLEAVKESKYFFS